VLATKSMAAKDKAVITVTAQKLEKFLKDLNQNEREALMAIVGEVTARSRLLAAAIQADGHPSGAQTEEPILTGILIGVGVAAAIEGAKIIGGVAGWLAGGSEDPIPWGEIVMGSG